MSKSRKKPWYDWFFQHPISIPILLAIIAIVAFALGTCRWMHG